MQPNPFAFLKTGDGVESFEEWDFAQDPTFIVNVPPPTRRFFWVARIGLIRPGTMIMVACENGQAARCVVEKVEENKIYPRQYLTHWPKLGGAVVRILGRNKHFVNLKDMERVNKLIKQGALKLDVSFDC